VIGDFAVEMPPVVTIGPPTLLRFGEQTVDFSGLFDWLSSQAEDGCWMFYLHAHDNIVVELDLLEPYNEAALRHNLHLFRNNPAAEGGKNLLGVIAPRHAWMLIMNHDNQGSFRIEFFGPNTICCDRSSVLRERTVES
jgi:hypothetical protein